MVKDEEMLENELKARYGHFAEIEGMRLEETKKWTRILKATQILTIILMVQAFFFLILPADSTILPEIIIANSATLLLSGFLMFLLFALISSVIERKISRTRKEIGLHDDEYLFLNVYKTRIGLDSFLGEQNLRRRAQYKQTALEKAKRMLSIVETWNYGNTALVQKMIGNQFELFRDNLRRLVIPNIAKGDEDRTRTVSLILRMFCIYLLSPTIEGLGNLNKSITDNLPYEEYKSLIFKEKVIWYFYDKPRVFRLSFAFVVTITVVAVLLCLGQNYGVVFAVGVTCFWGAFSGFDKLFRIKEKQSM